MSETNQGNPQGLNTNVPWMFNMDSDGVPSLYIVLPSGALALVFSFLTPEVYKKFVDDTIAGYERFLPRPVRDALDILDVYTGGDQKSTNSQKPPEGTGSGGIPAKI